MIKTSRLHPEADLEKKYCYESFDDGEAFEEKKQGRLPAMGWNSWNAFGSQNTEELTKIMADKLIELELDKLGYKYVVLDDGCYYPERVDGRLSNETTKFPGGFRALADYVHERGLKFGMYNDIGTNLCAGSAVGTCGYEDVDAKSYTDWAVDFLKVDNCYYLWDNATFSDKENAKYSYAPNIRSIRIVGENYDRTFAADDICIWGAKIERRGDYFTNIGTFDGTNVGRTPVGQQSGELYIDLEISTPGIYKIYVDYASGKEEGIGQWLQVAVGSGDTSVRVFDDLLPESEGPDKFVTSEAIKVQLPAGTVRLRFMNHRRQENVLAAYSAMFNALQQAQRDNDIILSICEWGKTMPHNWGYKVGNSWRILNDITFQVGSPGDNGRAAWTDPGTPSITSQYDKAVVMDEYAGLYKGWNDPDMLVIGMDNITDQMAETHMVMWCMMNSPLMLGMDLRRVKKGDEIWNIIANADLINLNQDSLGIQAKRVFCSLEKEQPDKVYITNHDRVDILAKPLANGDVAVSFINLSDTAAIDSSISIDTIVDFIGDRMINADDFRKAKKYSLKNLITKETKELSGDMICAECIKPYGNVTFRMSISR